MSEKKKYLITWDAGHGEKFAEIYAYNVAEAEREAYAAWRNEVEEYATYEAREISDELEEKRQ